MKEHLTILIQYHLTLFPPLVVLGAWMLLLPTPTLAQQQESAFQFVRIKFESNYGGGGGRFGRGGRDMGPWAHDYPTAEHNFHNALQRTTRVEIAGQPLVLTLADKEIFDHPMLYLCEPGFWTVKEEEAENLREYLERGGFILFDDFRGDMDWIQLYEQMQQVYPDVEPQEIPPDHPIWSIFYDIDPIEAPSLVDRGRYSRYEDRYLAYFDEEGRMFALACLNQDIGDGWEWPDRSFGDASTVSFQMGLNFLLYALTH